MSLDGQVKTLIASVNLNKCLVEGKIEAMTSCETVIVLSQRMKLNSPTLDPITVHPGIGAANNTIEV